MPIRGIYPLAAFSMYAALPPSMAVSFSVNVAAHCALSTVGNTCPHSKVMALVCLGCEVKEDLRFIIVSGPLGELQAYQAYHSPCVYLSIPRPH